MHNAPEISDNQANKDDNVRLTAELKDIMQSNKNGEVEHKPDVLVKEITPEDLLELDKIMPFGPKNYHQERLLSQQEGKSLYLIARNDNKLAGHVELILGGPNESEVKEVLSGVPEISAAEVRPEMQSKGIGTQIILAAEQVAKERGYKQICLGVSEENPRARALYERLGYTSRNLPRHSAVDSSGKTIFVDYLVKDL